MKRGVMLLTACMVAVFVAGGCATTASKKNGVELQTLKTQVADLESKVQQKDAEIDGLRQALSKTTEQKYNEMKESQPVSTHVPEPLQIQKALKNAGYDPGEIDGKLGRQSRKAIRAFQKANDLSVDGKVGARTWSVLAQYIEKK